LPRPRDNDEGGLYGNNIIAGNYKAGNVYNSNKKSLFNQFNDNYSLILKLIELMIEVTISHKGFFEFRLCPKSSASELVTQACLDQNLLTLEDGTTQYEVPTYVAGFHCINITFAFNNAMT
jgi:hypothetical protein